MQAKQAVVIHIVFSSPISFWRCVFCVRDLTFSSRVGASRIVFPSLKVLRVYDLVGCPRDSFQKECPEMAILNLDHAFSGHADL